MTWMLGLALLLFGGATVDAAVHFEVNSVRALAERMLGGNVSSQLVFEALHDDEKLDVFEVESSADAKLIVRGSSTTALTSGLGWYLKYIANVHFSWSGDRLATVKEGLPPVDAKIRLQRVVEYTHYMNVCTLSYSMVWWDWSRWERELDWMALSGVNTFLASVGQEYAWRKLFTDIGLSQAEIAAYFTGPAFLAWQRMGNIQAWAGPLPDAYIDQQFRLQKRIFARATQLGIAPILPAFAGFVPEAISRVFPKAHIRASSSWGAFNTSYTPVHMVEPTDPLFVEIGTRFIKVQQELYAMDSRLPHLYNADTFNEMKPKSSDLDYLKQASSAMAQSLANADTSAIWIMQAWLFQDASFWSEDRIRAYLSGIGDDQMIILDLFSEVSPVYTRYKSGFFGKRWIWNELHNFGGNHGLYGRMQVVSTEPIRAREESNARMVGVGFTPEGINQNFLVYELLTEMAFLSQAPDLQHWTRAYVHRRYGATPSEALTAWTILLDTVYTSKSRQWGVTKSVFVLRPSLQPKRGSFMRTQLYYDPKKLEQAALKLLHAANVVGDEETYQYDLVDVTRQVLSNKFLQWYNEFVSAEANRDLPVLTKLSEAMLTLLADLDKLLSSNKHFLLGRWLKTARARAVSSDSSMASLFEFNARNQITLWGPHGEISDYASKQYAGLVKDYYRPRWQLFFKQVLTSVEEQQTFDEAAFQKDCLALEEQWQHGARCYAPEPIHNTVDVAKDVLGKYIDADIKLATPGAGVGIAIS